MPLSPSPRTASYATATKLQPILRRAAHRRDPGQPKPPVAQLLASKQPTARSSVVNQPTANHAGALGLARSFELVKVELFSVPAHAHIPFEVDVVRSARAVLGTAKRLATLLPELNELGGYDVRPVRRLRFYAGAVLYTNILALAAGPEDLQKLAMRDAAYVLFLQAYQHVRHGVMLLRWSENDAGAFLPALCRRRPWMIEGSRDESRGRGEESSTNGTVRREAALVSPIRHREVAMG
jgi:hypothetical protein